MKRRLGRAAQWVIAAAGSLVGSIALAQLPQGGGKPSTPDARALGLTDAMLDYCAKADPDSVAKRREQLRQLVRGASKETLVRVRRSDEYKRAHDGMVDFVGKVDEHNAKRLCAEPLAINK